MNEIELSRFIVFCIECYKRHASLSGADVSDLFRRHGVVDYLKEGYDVLHSLGENALVDDIRDYIDRSEEESPLRGSVSCEL